MAEITEEQKREIREELKERIEGIAEYIRGLGFYAKMVADYARGYWIDLRSLQGVIKEEETDPKMKAKIIAKIDNEIPTFTRDLIKIGDEIAMYGSRLTELGKQIEESYIKRLKQVL